VPRALRVEVAGEAHRVVVPGLPLVAQVVALAQIDLFGHAAGPY
jgi:hypothetical protein